MASGDYFESECGALGEYTTIGSELVVGLGEKS
jgi:hypothetical protein